ncbi:hypothetical protein JTE90_007509 [Oedothorax gibbosus]|uniref:Uncharacterized protein n=1 Tax=Oedothorax gibbosus TaxID=931172 RepID=A0AAV6VP07_9ARAC|nr:hypothetical protein JTE90_007509 [Oedothorax gibbosus]
MFFETIHNSVNFLTTALLDIRFQIVFGALVLAQWATRLPRKKKGSANKSVFITGCDTGMGHRMAIRFDELDMNVFAGCLRPNGPGAQKLRTTCSSRLHIVPLDITKEDQVEAAVEYVKANLPDGQRGLYCLINNAGVLTYAGFDLMTFRMTEEVISINLVGTLRVTKHFLPLLYEAPGRIVAVTSILSRFVAPKSSVYCASKYGLEGFFAGLRHDVEHKGIRVSTIEPGDFTHCTDIMQYTRNHLDEMWDNLTPEEQESQRGFFEGVKKSLKREVYSKSDQEKVYKVLLDDVEDAMFVEEPKWRYVSAPWLARFGFWMLRNLPERLIYKLLSRRGKKND